MYNSDYIYNIPEINNIIKNYVKEMKKSDRNQKVRFKRKYNKVIEELMYINRIKLSCKLLNVSKKEYNKLLKMRCSY